jgi:hypothetical protein
MQRADVKDLVFAGNPQEIMNKVPAAERMSQVQLVEARTKADVQKIESQAKAEAQRMEAESRAAAQRLAAQGDVEVQRLNQQGRLSGDYRSTALQGEEEAPYHSLDGLALDGRPRQPRIGSASVQKPQTSFNMNSLKAGALAFSLFTLTVRTSPAQTNAVPRPYPFPPNFGARHPGALSVRAWDNKHFLSFHATTSFHLATNVIVLALDTGDEPPKQIAVMVKPLSSPPRSSTLPFQSPTNLAQMRAASEARMAAFKAQVAEERIDFKTATWRPFTKLLPVELGPAEGKRLVLVAARWGGPETEHSTGTHVWVDRTPPQITITNPPQLETSQPMIQLQGYSDEELRSIRYDVFNASNRVANAQGFVNHVQFDPVDMDKAISYFTCYDIQLALGSNTIVLRCADEAGNVATNRLTYVFSLEHDKTPPVISLDQPINGHSYMGTAFTARGRLDDPTARVTAAVSASGESHRVSGLVERNGYFWIEHIPLGPGANSLAITATDAAGNSSSTNLVILKGEGMVTMDPVPANQLWQPDVTVTGRVLPGNQRVFINGIEAQVKPDGTWLAYKVPVKSPNGGTAVFEMTALPLAGAVTNNPVAAARPHEAVSVSAGLGTNAVTLNVGSPACGSFNLHLSGTAGGSFILQASTNLLDWTPLLTNLNSAPVFDFTDTDVAGHKCRFFRVTPIP